MTNIRKLVLVLVLMAIGVTSVSAVTYGKCKRDIQQASKTSCPSNITPKTGRIEREKLTVAYKACRKEFYLSKICGCHLHFYHPYRPITRGTINWNQWEFDHCQSFREEATEAMIAREELKAKLGATKSGNIKCLGKRDIARIEKRGESYIAPKDCPNSIEDTAILLPSDDIDALSKALRTGYIREGQLKGINGICDVVLRATGAKFVADGVRLASKVITRSKQITGTNCVSLYSGIKRGVIRIAEDSGVVESDRKASGSEISFD